MTAYLALYLPSGFELPALTPDDAHVVATLYIACDFVDPVKIREVASKKPRMSSRLIKPIGDRLIESNAPYSILLNKADCFLQTQKGSGWYMAIRDLLNAPYKAMRWGDPDKRDLDYSFFVPISDWLQKKKKQGECLGLSYQELYEHRLWNEWSMFDIPRQDVRDTQENRHLSFHRKAPIPMTRTHSSPPFYCERLRAGKVSDDWLPQLILFQQKMADVAPPHRLAILYQEWGKYTKHIRVPPDASSHDIICQIISDYHDVYYHHLSNGKKPPPPLGLTFLNLNEINFDMRHISTFCGIDFSGSKLVRSSFKSADFSGANFTGADLTEADLSYATDEEGNVILTHAKLKNLRCRAMDDTSLFNKLEDYI